MAAGIALYSLNLISSTCNCCLTTPYQLSMFRTRPGRDVDSNRWATARRTEYWNWTGTWTNWRIGNGNWTYTRRSWNFTR